MARHWCNPALTTMSNTNPVVSAVIPTRNRPGLVVRAVRSALNQTFAELEVVVVVDGADPITVAALRQIEDQRLRVIELPESVRGAEARNIGARQARGEWIAFLDDDDEWLPEKILDQLEAAADSRCKSPIVSCRMYAQTPHGRYLWPTRLRNAEEPLSEYILARSTLLQSGGMITCSTLLVPRELLLQVPFRSAQKRHQDWDWLLHALTMQGTKLIIAPEALTIYHAEEEHPTMSGGSDWRYSSEWIEDIRDIVTPRAYSAFLLTTVTSAAVRAGERRACISILKQAIYRGRLAGIDLLLFCIIAIIPRQSRGQLRALLSGLHL